jgi:hypothetical protein
MNKPSHPDLSVHDYSLLIDSIDWELDFLEHAGWNNCRRSFILRSIQRRIQQFVDTHDKPTSSGMG